MKWYEAKNYRQSIMVTNQQQYLEIMPASLLLRKAAYRTRVFRRLPRNTVVLLLLNIDGKQNQSIHTLAAALYETGCTIFVLELRRQRLISGQRLLREWERYHVKHED